MRYAWFVRVSGKSLQFFGIELLKLFHSHINLLRNVNLPLRKGKKYSRQEYNWERRNTGIHHVLGTELDKKKHSIAIFAISEKLSTQSIIKSSSTNRKKGCARGRAFMVSGLFVQQKAGSPGQRVQQSSHECFVRCSPRIHFRPPVISYLY